MKSILLIQTGGTIAMNVSDDQKPTLNPQKWTELMYQAIPELSEIADIKMERLFFEDSSDINKKHWAALAEFIRNNYLRRFCDSARHRYYGLYRISTVIFFTEIG